MLLRAKSLMVLGFVFAVVTGVTPTLRTSATGPLPLGLDLACPRPAYAGGSCSLTALVCANDSSPGCEVICFGEQTPTCEQGSCSLGGNIATMNRCYCK